MNKRIAIIGAGHMGMAICRGLLRTGDIQDEQITLSGPDKKKILDHAKGLNVHIVTENAVAVRDAGIVFIAVKPRMVASILTEIRNALQKGTILISVAACVSMKLLERDLQRSDISIARILPNIPVEYGKGVVGVYLHGSMIQDDVLVVQDVLKELGMMIPCESDDQLEKVSMICGCGPGYVGYFMNSLSLIANDVGFTQKQAIDMVRQMFYGTAIHVEKTQMNGNELLTSVATKGGITEEVVNAMTSFGFPKIFKESIEKGFKKVNNIAKDLEKEN